MTFLKMDKTVQNANEVRTICIIVDPVVLKILKQK